jgi:peroxiredoxin
MGGAGLRGLVSCFFLMAALTVLLGCDGVPDSEATSEPPAAAKPALSEAPRVGHLAPDFVLTTLDGREVRLSDYRGHVVFLNFWATWCGPCKVEMPAMDRLYREYRRQGFAILAVSTDPEGPAVTRPYREALGLTFTIAHDPDAVVMRLYGVRTLPVTFLVDREGVITHRIFGARDWQDPEAHDGIRRLLQVR